MTDDEIIAIAVKTSLLNFIDNETPRRFFVSGHAELDDVVAFGRIIAATALEEAARVAEQQEEERIGVPCPDGIKGCAVFHFRRRMRPRNHLEIAAAIRALKEK